jgi:hypothetical protein
VRARLYREDSGRKASKPDVRGMTDIHPLDPTAFNSKKASGRMLFLANDHRASPMNFFMYDIHLPNGVN